MIDLLEKSTKTRWQELGFAGPRPRKVSFLLSGGVAGKHGEVLFRAFRDDESKPLFLGKIPRDETARRWCQHEDLVLRELAEAAPQFVGSLFPRALLREETGNRFATSQTILPGTPMDRQIAILGGGQGAARTMYRQAQDWLKTFWAQTGLLEGTEAPLWERFLRGAHFYLEWFEPPVELRDEVEQLIAEMETRRENPALCGFGHGDFLVTNLIVEGDRVGAVNWEFAEKRQFPWVDPVHFVVDYSLRHGMRTEKHLRAGFERGFFEEGWLRTLNAQFVDESFAEGGVSKELFSLALPASLLASLHRMARFFSIEDPLTAQWRELVERCLRPGARDELAAAFSQS